MTFLRKFIRLQQQHKTLQWMKLPLMLSRCQYHGYTNEPTHPIPGRQPKSMTADEAVSAVKSGDHVFIHGAAATPRALVPALAEHGKKNKLKDVRIHHIHTEGAGEYNAPEFEGIFRSNSLFTGANSREAINAGRADFTPIFLGEIPKLFYQGIIKPDVAMVTVSPADEHGYHSLGTSCDVARAALMHSKYIIGQVNKFMPRTFGHSVVHQSHFDALVDGPLPMPDHAPKNLTDTEKKIGQLIAANLVEDGATMQMGIGAIPDAVLADLVNHKNLGIHSEMFSDGVVDLCNKGVITNSEKKLQVGRITASFLIGSKKLYEFVDNNPFIVMMGIDYVNDEFNIAQNPKVTAINSCIEVDILGQVCADSIGTRVYSGFGGQVDFLRGAAKGLDGKGKAILAMPSVTRKGESKISISLKPGNRMDSGNMVGDNRAPCRVLKFHEKFSSPSRRRPVGDTLKKQEEKQAKAQEAREKLLEKRAEKFKDIFKKVEEIKAQKEEQQIQLRLSMEMRLQKAGKKRQEQINKIVRKAHDEDEKVSEILFINSLGADTKKHEIFSKEKVHESRLQDLQEERQRKLEEKASKEKAFEERRKAIEAEKQARIEKLKEQRKLKVMKIQRQFQEKEKERLELAFQKELDRKSKISALNALHAAEKEELQKKILAKQEESKRRHEENMEQIRQKALELSVKKSSSTSDEALVCVPYDTVKMCALCKVIIKSEVYLFGHLRGKRHNDAIIKQNDGKIPSPEELENFNLKFIIDAQALGDGNDDYLKSFQDCDSEKLKQAKKKSKKLKQKLVNKAVDFEKTFNLEKDVQNSEIENISKESKQKLAKIIKDLGILSSLAKLLNLSSSDDFHEIAYGVNLKHDGTQFMLTLKVTQLCGTVSLLYGFLLHSGAPVREEKVPAIVPDHTLNVALEIIRFFNYLMLLDINLIQSILGSEGLSLQIRHICSYLIWYCSHHLNNSDLLNEVILLIGNFVVLNNDNQTLLQSGQRPTVVQQLCSLPFDYFSDNRLKQILFPTLIVCCFNNDDNLNILKQEMSTTMLSKFIDQEIMNSQLDQLENDRRQNNIIAKKWSLPIRFPKHKWIEAKTYFQRFK
uniref:S phase cyclin A-associated protein in the endoplasmic reticulum-like isoform X2 n=1 Tax=Dermatophagoides pteronyssinus TaxID=6956 RepID=A0A6P6Y002_DERPT|nr:S phase cyclin A-associated protein in the endoplasmic reticulum-like isoform X2 [Dermatophagoides pteronyssinus]